MRSSCPTFRKSLSVSFVAAHRILPPNMMELFIETLTGTAFELRVSPFETIMSVKAKIQRLEGIPISQQHLIWQSMELEDDYCLHDYSIHDGATLKLVLAMRGGPINTRRIAMEDPALREMAEYMEANREEILDKLPGNRHVTLLVYREGDQLNFFRVVDRGDGTLTPLSESLSPLHFSGASMYNLYDDDEEEEPAGRETAEENVKTREKMQLLRSKMENLTLTKKPKKKTVPRPPSSGRASGRTRSSAHRLGSSAGHPSRQPLAALAKNPLPPVGQAPAPHLVTAAAAGSVPTPVLNARSASGAQNPEPCSGRSSSAAGAETPSDPTPLSARRHTREVLESAKLKRPLSSVKEDSNGSSSLHARNNSKLPLAAAAIESVESEGKEDTTSTTKAADDGLNVVKGQQSSSAEDRLKTDSETSVAPSTASAEPQLLKNKLPLPPTNSAQKKEPGPLLPPMPPSSVIRELPPPSSLAADGLQKDWMPTWSSSAHSYAKRHHTLSMRPSTSSSKGLERILDHGYDASSAATTSGVGGSPTAAAAAVGRPPTTSASSRRSKELGLESVVRPPTSKYGNLERKQGILLESLTQSEARGLLRQASLERLGSSNLANFVRSASKSRASYHIGSASLKDGSRVTTPEGRLVSARLQQRVSAASRDRMSPTPRLPPVKQKKKASKRCFVCAKKTGLATSYQCRCGNNFCATHRYAESHDCTFDYKTEGRKLLEQANPVVSAPKLPKI